MPRSPLVPTNQPPATRQATQQAQEVAQLLARGLALHQQGQLAQARAIYEQVIARHPGNFDALHLLGVIASQSGEQAQAAELIGKALQINPDDASAHNNLGNALKRLKRLDDALASYDRAIALQPEYADAYANRGAALQALKRPTEALASYDRAIALKPNQADTHRNRGVVLKELQRLAEALASHDRAIALKPNDANAYIYRGNTLLALKRPDEALASYDRAMTLKPDLADAYGNRGIALQALNRTEEALANYDRALALKPDYAEAYNNRGNALLALNRPEEALADYERAIALKPDYADAYGNRGAALQALKRLDEALTDFSRAIALKPDHAEAYWNKAVALLLCGDFVGGWGLYEWRWKVDGRGEYKRNLTQPLWLGAAPLAGKRILLYAEQGLGDSIQLCRYAKLVCDLGAHVILEVPQPLMGLFGKLAGVAELAEQGKPLPAFDYHCPLLSLPLAFSTTLDSIPAPASYLGSDDAKLRMWEEKLGAKTRPRIGLVWSGNTAHRNDQNRSLALSQLIAHLPVGLDYVSLQKEVRDSEQAALGASQLRHFGDALADFTDTAALCNLMDLVISVDTSVAHLAAALGKPTWILLPHVPDWRWLLDRDDSPWYPSVRLYRQGEDRRWGPVLQRIAAALSEVARRDQLASSTGDKS